MVSRLLVEHGRIVGTELASAGPEGDSSFSSQSVGSRAVQPLAGLLVVDLTRHLPGPFASRELLRLGARVVRLEAPEGDPLRDIAPEWDAALNAGKESVVCDLKREPEAPFAPAPRTSQAA